MSKRIEVDPSADLRRRRLEPPQPQRQRNDRLAYWLGTILIVFGLLTGAIAFTMVRSHTINPVVGLVNYFVPAPETVFGKQRIFVLLLGLDYDYTITDQPSSKDARTDKIEVYAIDFPSKVIKTIAVPRDMDAVVNGSENKINAAYHYGGAWNTDAVVGGLLGMSKNDKGHYFDKYIALRINASKDVINAIGGLEVPVTETLNYDDTWGHLHIHFKPGLQHMNGDEAVSYARFRHDACSDPCRIKRQQQISKLIIEKLKNDKFNDLTHIASLIDVIRKNVDTNLSADEMKSLGWAFRDLNTGDIHQTQVPFVTDKELRCCGDVLVPDTAGLAKIVADFVGPYVAATPPPSAESLASVKPSTVRLDVRNGSGIPGLGAKAAEVLRKDGYVIASIGNAASFDFDVTQIRVPAGVPNVGERIRADLRLPQAALLPIPAASAAASASTAAIPSPAVSDAAGSKAALTEVTINVGRDYRNAPTPAPATSAKL